jgi:hypothetical protein
LVEHSTSSYSDKVIISPVTRWLMFSTVLTTEKAEQIPASSIDAHLITTIEDYHFPGGQDNLNILHR